MPNGIFFLRMESANQQQLKNLRMLIDDRAKQLLPPTNASANWCQKLV